MQNSKTFLLVVLGILAAFGPFVTDMYLPGLPAMTAYFGTTASMVQLGITTASWAWLSDKLLLDRSVINMGAVNPLLLSLGVFFFSTIGCIFSWNVEVFIFFRFLQGMAGSWRYCHIPFGGNGLLFRERVGKSFCHDFGCQWFSSYYSSYCRRSPVEIYQLAGDFFRFIGIRNFVAIAVWAIKGIFTPGKENYYFRFFLIPDFPSAFSQT